MDQEIKFEELEPENFGKMDIERRKNQVFFKLCILNRVLPLLSRFPSGSSSNG